MPEGITALSLKSFFILDFILDAVFLGDLAQHLAGVAHDHHPGGNVPGHHASGTDDGAFPDGDAGQVAVATDDTDSVAKLTVYSSAMEQVLSWNLTSAEGTPLRMAFSPDSRRIAVAAVTANRGC